MSDQLVRRSHRSLSPIGNRGTITQHDVASSDDETNSQTDDYSDKDHVEQTRPGKSNDACGHLDTEYRERLYLKEASMELLATNDIQTCRPEILTDGRLIISCPGIEEIENESDLDWLQDTSYKRGVLTVTVFPWKRPLWFTLLYSYVSIQFRTALVCLLFALCYYAWFGLPVDISEEMYQYAYMLSVGVSGIITLVLA